MSEAEKTGDGVSSGNGGGSGMNWGLMPGDFADYPIEALT